MANPTTVEELLDYWPGNVPFKGSLVSENGSCMCAQGQALHFLDNMSADDLRNLEQPKADKRIAELFGISRAHAVLLRLVNDRQDGAPAVVIRDPAQVIGDQAHVVLAFWRHLDRMSPDDWITLASAEASAEASAWASAWASARDSAWASARVSAWATNEIQGAAVMRAKGLPFFFLPLFGFADPEAVLAADRT